MGIPGSRHNGNLSVTDLTVVNGLSGETVSMVSGSTYFLGTSATIATFHFCTSSGAYALCSLMGAYSTTVVIINGPSSHFGRIGGSTNFYNCYWDSTAKTYSLDNRTGATVNMNIVRLSGKSW